jgi:hypothetical protein
MLLYSSSVTVNLPFNSNLTDLLGAHSIRKNFVFFFKHIFWIDIWAKMPKYNAVNTNFEDATPSCLIRTAKVEKNAPNYSASLYTSASVRILRITDSEKGVAPSKTLSLRCLHKHQHTSMMPVSQILFPPMPGSQPVRKHGQLRWKTDLLAHQRKKKWPTPISPV